MTRKTIWTLSLLLALATTNCENDVIVEAFAMTSRTRSPISSIHGRRVMWSSSKASLVEEESSSTKLATGEDLSSTEKETSNESSEPTIAVNASGDMNADDDIDSMMNEAINTGKSTDDESDEENLMQQIKDSGVAGVISYAAWELTFWTVSVPVCVLGYKEVTGHWPDFNDKDDLSKLGAEAFAFVNFARFAVPLRIGLALGTTPWIQENVVDVFLVDNGSDEDRGDETVGVVEEEIPSDDEHSDDEENTEKVGRFRIRSRVGNLINRVFKRKNRVQQEEE